MIKEIKLPAIEENVESGTVSSILVSPGDTIKEGDPVIEMETEKASMEIPSPDAGTVKEIKVGEGDEISVGELILTIEQEGSGEGKPEEKESESKDEPEPEKESEPEGEPEPEEEKAPEEKPKPKQEQKAEPEAGKQPEASEARLVPAAPSVRRFAREIGIDITEVKGTGPSGRISVDDVKNHNRQEKESGRPVRSAAAAEFPDFSQWGKTRREPMSKVRKITAEHTLEGWQSIPHVTQFDKADSTGLEAFRKKYQKYADEQGAHITVTALLVKMASHALKRFPRFNASIDMKNEEIVYKEYVNIGVAVDTERGLLVPVIKDAYGKSIITIAKELGDLAERARNRKIKPDEMKGGSFIISNLGGIGGTQFTPLIYPPQAAILGVSRGSMEPVYDEENGDFQARLMLPLSLSYDHRIIDGADGARFLRWFCEALEQPMLIMLDDAGEKEED